MVTSQIRELFFARFMWLTIIIMDDNLRSQSHVFDKFMKLIIDQDFHALKILELKNLA